MKLKSLNLCILLGLALSVVNAYGQMPSNYILRDLSAELGGNSKFIKWSNLTAGNGKYEGSTYLINEAHPESTIIQGRLRPISSIGRSSGLYNWTGDFGTVATVQSPFAAKTAVLQFAMMPNPARSHEEVFTYDHAAYNNPGDVYDGGGSIGDPNGADSYNYIQELADMHNLINDYAGGPLLKWTAANNTSGYLQAVGYGILGEPIWLDAGAIAGFYYNFAWQWDLSAIPGDIVEVEVTTPIPVHSSAIGQQLTIGDTFNHLFPVPEPSFYAALLGLAALAFAYRRRKASRA